jgi:hypothetical protein
VVKVRVALDRALLERLDAAAAARGVSRSALLAELAARGLGAAVGPGARLEARRALAALAALPWDRVAEDTTAAIRAARNADRKPTRRSDDLDRLRDRPGDREGGEGQPDRRR